MLNIKKKTTLDGEYDSLGGQLWRFAVRDDQRTFTEISELTPLAQKRANVSYTKSSAQTINTAWASVTATSAANTARFVLATSAMI